MRWDDQCYSGCDELCVERTRVEYLPSEIILSSFCPRLLSVRFLSYAGCDLHMLKNLMSRCISTLGVLLLALITFSCATLRPVFCCFVAAKYSSFIKTADADYFQCRFFMFRENRDKIETYLAFGASRFEACKPIAIEGLRLALLPTINQMSVIGELACGWIFCFLLV